MKKYFLAAAVLFGLNAGAQKNAASSADSLKWVNEINEQVWKPFTTHLISGDKAAFSSVHSKQITRVQIDDGVILDFEKYFPPQDKKNSNPSKKNDRKFELRFDKRISNGAHAWESGYYKGSVLQDGKETRTYYGRFYVVLQKENGNWKILVDADTGKEATKENFETARPME
jgi:hypothetical protein